MAFSAAPARYKNQIPASGETRLNFNEIVKNEILGSLGIRLKEMPQIRRATFAALCITIVVISLLVGIQLSNYLGHARTTTLEQTFLRTTTIDSTLTKTITYYGPAYVLVSGQVNSINYNVLAVNLDDYPGYVYTSNLTYYGGSSSNEYAYWATGFSVIVPNNENYSVSLIFSTGTNDKDTVSVGFYPLFNNINGTGELFIGCNNTAPLGSMSYPIACQS